MRERQHLFEEWQVRDKMLIVAVSRPTGERDALAEQDQHTRLSAIDERITEIDKLLAKSSPTMQRSPTLSP